VFGNRTNDGIGQAEFGKGHDDFIVNEAMVRAAGMKKPCRPTKQ
jgi:hypothetical protein